MLTSFDIKRDTNLFLNISLVKLRYQQLDLFNSDALTSAHKVHVHSVFYMYTTPSAVCLCTRKTNHKPAKIFFELVPDFVNTLPRTPS